MDITEMEEANRYLRERYMPAFNEEFSQPAQEEGSAFVEYVGGDIDDVLCEQYERTVGNDNCVSFEGAKLQIPEDRARMHYVRVKVRVYRYPDGRLAIFHGPRFLARYEADGRLLGNKPIKDARSARQSDRAGGRRLRAAPSAAAPHPLA
ncbi:hypothetical protein FACS189460_3660 [Deltaproteobacteria bacterium]|nr:hypothetical protein FACS189460_3660 [Deltaproteobacteria bacterium]